MKISIIVPTFNRAHMVTDTIDSILNQTFKDFELIIVDNYSTDTTEQVIKKYTDERLKFHRHENGGVVAVNRNYGISQARGEYIAFCDDDDLWLPDKLEKQINELEKDSRPGLVCTNAVIFNETGDTVNFHDSGVTANDFILKSLLKTNRIICSSVLVRKSVLDDVGLMDTSPDIFTAEDYELWLRIARKYHITYINEPLVKYRVHSGGYKKSSTAAMKRNRAVYKKLLNKGVIGKWLYRRLNLRALAIEFLWYTHTIKLASWVKRLVCGKR